MRCVLIAALAFFAFTGTAQAYCKYQAPDGSWVFGDTCSSMSNEEITQKAGSVIEKREQAKDRDIDLERRRLSGYGYSQTDQGGVPIKKVEPNRRSRTWWESE